MLAPRRVSSEPRPRPPAQLSAWRADWAGTGGYGVHGNVSASTGATVGAKGNSTSTAGTGVRGASTATTGATTGVSGYVASATGIAGAFDDAGGGKILSGENNGVEKFSVDGSEILPRRGRSAGLA